MRILFVEDDKKIANAVKKGLEQESYAVDIFYEGQIGLGRAISGDYDLIILDRMLPEIDGLKICSAVRKEKIHTPILILTAKDQVLDKVEGLNAGADDYLTKPFAFEELLARIQALLRRPKNLKGDVLVVDDLVLDRMKMEVRRKNKLVNLSKKEFSLLEYLARNPNRILTKDNIISHVWDYDSDILPNTVEVFIGNLRKKIDRGFPDSKKLIHTVHGFGYKLKS